MSMEEVEAVLDVHLRGGFHVSQPAFTVMRDNNYGRFVFTSSASGLFGNFGQANYGAAKAGLVGLSNVIAIEGEKYNIKSNAIAPIAKTRMTEDLLGPFADMVAPEQVTSMVVYLCSEANEHTHEIFTVGGGRYGRVFVATNKGWFAGPGAEPSAEEVADHIDEIRDISDHIVPLSSNDEIDMLGQMLAG
jgi:NAD(P)-dependent dehydrogenase (short-subunit alcohol dehydrogenase family)